jgi:uncharacterized protein YacL
MSLEFILRLIGMIVLGLGGLRLGVSMATVAGEPPEIWAIIISMVGALAGLILTPYFTTRPARLIHERLNKMPPQQLVAWVTGLVIGLIVAALISTPLSMLPEPLNGILPILAALVCAYFGTTTFSVRRRDIFGLFRMQWPASPGVEDGAGLTPGRQVLLDTSVIIDGRIADISMTGFINGPMVVPNFVLNELQHIADSSDPMRRNRGRRGLEVLNHLQKEAPVPVVITDADFEGIYDVDEKLILLAKNMGCAIVTNDYNLNRVAEIQGVLVLNVNELANAVKAIFLPGEPIMVHIIQEGKELGQGVGYLDDGTMVVVEEGRRYLHQTIEGVVTKVLQTSAGRMIFARPEA